MKYIAFFDVPEIKSENRYVNAAARGVIEYMIKVFSSIESVEVLSPGRTLNHNGIYHKKTVNVSENVTIRFPFTFGVKSKIGRLLSLLWTQAWLFSYLFFHTKRGEKVVFYHSLSLMTIISVLCKIKGIQPILEFREIYSDINKVSKRLTRKEHTYYQCAYGYIFPSDAIRRILGVNDKPYVLAPGSYSVHRVTQEEFHDGKIHCVYAGNLRKDKGGAYLAADAAEYLSDQYIIHILSGSYSEKAIEEFQKEIEKISQKTKCRILFEGGKYGEEFFAFLNKCDIGLATQNDGDFSNTSFPSKILTYLGCGLCVIAPPIDAVRLSPISNLVTEYKDFDPTIVAEAIIGIDSKGNDTRLELEKLHYDLVSSVKTMIA